MKIKIFKLFLLIFINTFNTFWSFSQNLPIIKDISYVTTQTKKCLLPKDIDLKDLSQYDLLALKQTKIIQKHHLFFDDNNDIQYEINNIDNKNFPSAGITLPQKMIINKSGFFLDKQEGKSPFMNHSELSFDFINGINTEAKNSGFISGFAFQVPKETKDKNSDNKYTTSKGVITIENNEGKMIWNTNINRIYEVEYLGDSDNVNYKRRTEFDEELCGERLKTKETEYISDTLPSGLCFRIMIETKYSDYRIDCNEGLK